MTTNELQQSSPEPQSNIPPVTPDVRPSKPKRSNKYLWWSLGIAVIFICLCSILCIVLAATSFGKGIIEKAPVESVIDSYMKYMEAKDVESAYALFSTRAQRQIPISKFQELVEGNNYFVFKGYQSLSVVSLNVGASVNTNPDMPQGTVAKITGTIAYEGGFQGTFNGTLEKVNGKWLLDGIYVNVPPNKFQP